jgi:hypothetical protein
MVSDWRARGLLNVACPTLCGFVENGGQLDLRGVDDLALGAVPATDTLRSSASVKASAQTPNGGMDGGGAGINGAARRMASNIWAAPSWAGVLAEAMVTASFDSGAFEIAK